MNIPFIVISLALFVIFTIFSWFKGWKWKALIPGLIVIITMVLSYATHTQNQKFVGLIIAIAYLSSFALCIVAPK